MRGGEGISFGSVGIEGVIVNVETPFMASLVLC